ncbi:hypothetical protein ABFS82_06G110600 [Erythranthe guttata]
MDEDGSSRSPSADSDDSASSDSSSMADSPCSHCWRGPFYFAMSLTLAYLAVTTMKHSAPENPPPPPLHGLALNASAVLRRHGGFHITAALLQVSPDLFFSGNASTVFAIQDSAFSNLSIPPWEMRQLLLSHAAPSALPTAELLKKPPGFCFKTLAENKNLVITKNNPKTGPITINNVPISDPDIFLEGPFSVHGVLRPLNEIPAPACGFSDHRNVEWTGIIKLLSSNGYVSFAIGLNAVLDKIVRNYEKLSSVTVFAPPNSGLISSPSPFLDRIVRLHILPQRLNYMELIATKNSSLKTLIPSFDLKIEKFTQTLVIDGVEITRPDLFSSETFVVHGISRDFDVVELFSSFK